MPKTVHPAGSSHGIRALGLVIVAMLGMAGWAAYFVHQERTDLATIAPRAKQSEALVATNTELTREVTFLIAAGSLEVTDTLSGYVSAGDLLGSLGAPALAAEADRAGAEAMHRLLASGVEVPEAVHTVLAPLSPTDLEAVAAGTPISIPAASYDEAVIYLRKQFPAAQDASKLALAQIGEYLDRPEPWQDPTFLGVLAGVVFVGAAGALALRRSYRSGDAKAVHLQGQIQRLGELLDKARRVTSEIEFEAAAGRLLDETLSLVPASWAIVFQVEGNRLVPVAQEGVEAPKPFRVGTGLVGMVVETATPNRGVVQTDPSFPMREGWTNLLAAPMVKDGRVVGALAVGSSYGVPFSSEDEFALKLFAIASSNALEIARRHEETQEMVNSDPLTGLANRRRLDGDLRDGIPNLVAGGRPVAFAMVDVDHFKKFNDTYGHPAGDVLLRQVAVAISAAVRTEDIVYRYGGEEFSVLLPGASAAEALRVAERVRWSVQNVPLTDDHGRPVPPVTVSVGVSCRTDTNSEALVADADGALYSAKQAGRNCVIAAP